MDQSDKDDAIKKIDEIINSLKDENYQLEKVLVEAKEKIEAETAEDMATIDAASKDLDVVEQQADMEENQGQINTVKQQIDQL